MLANSEILGVRNLSARLCVTWSHSLAVQAQLCLLSPPETRGTKPEARNRKQEIGDRRPETGNPELGNCNPTPEIRNAKFETVSIRPLTSQSEQTLLSTSTPS